MDSAQQLKLIFLALVAAHPSLENWNDSRHGRAALSGLDGMSAVVEDIKPEIEDDGLTRDQLQGDIERILQDAGIKVLSEREYCENERRPLLAVVPNILKIKSIPVRITSFYVYSINVTFSQRVYLPELHCLIPGRTWTTGFLGYSPNLNDIRESVRNMVGIFVEAFLSVNPGVKI